MVAAVVGMLSGCASLPSSSAPQVVGVLDRPSANQAVPAPDPTADPDQLLQDFLKATADPTGKHAAARQYLTREMSERWDDAAATTIVDSPAVMSDASSTKDRRILLLRANRRGQLLSNGIASGMYQPESGLQEARFTFVRIGGEWRIDQLPAGVIMDHRTFTRAYQKHPVYFLNPTETAMVPDLRWTAVGRDQLGMELIKLLGEGPQSSLKPAVRNELGSVSMSGKPTRLGGVDGAPGFGLGGIEINLRGMGSLDRHNRELLAAQIIWTLDSAGMVGPYQLLADGKPIDERHPNGWTRDDVLGLDPHSELRASIGLDVLRNGSLVTVSDTGVTPSPGFFGSAGTLRTATLSRDAKTVAAVADAGPGREQLWVGNYGGGAVSALTAGAIGKPTWAPNHDALWVVVDGVRVVRVLHDQSTGQLATAEVDATSISSLGRISAIRLSRDGVQAALIVDGRVYSAVVVIQSNGKRALTSPRQIPIEGNAQAGALDWIDGETLLVAQHAGGDLLVSIPLDGSMIRTFVGQNLTQPLDAVDVTSGAVYASDPRALFQLKITNGSQDTFWREVPSLAGGHPKPVLPG